MKEVADEFARVESRFRSLVDQMPLMVAVYRQGRFLFANNALLDRLGYTLDEIVDIPLLDILHPDDRAVASERIQRVSRDLVPLPYAEERLLCKDGAVVTAEVKAVPLFFDGLPSVVAFAIDVTERRRFEEHLRQSARMEAVGRLAGGVAHDFNNLLSIIINSAHFLRQRIDSADPTYQDAEQIHAAARRASELTRQLLTFSRGAEPAAEVLNVNGVLRELERLITGTLGESISLRMAMTPIPCRVKLARSNLEQVLINLAVNARDAMPHGGVLSIETWIVDADGDPDGPALDHGRYVRITVNDTGVGMAPEIASHAFEPFFTTKSHGKGTGLGLSITYGIIRKAGGQIMLSSSPGLGTTFTIWLPLSDIPSLPSIEALLVPAPRGSGQVILVVEDEEGVRAVIVRILTEQGFQVIEAPTAERALQLIDEHPGQIHLLLTDVILPRLSGPAVVQKAQRRRPGLRVLFMSGYTGDELATHGISWDNSWILQKPFEQQQLLRKIISTLDAPPRSFVPDTDAPAERRLSSPPGRG